MERFFKRLEIDIETLRQLGRGVDRGDEGVRQQVVDRLARSIEMKVARDALTHWRPYSLRSILWSHPGISRFVDRDDRTLLLPLPGLLAEAWVSADTRGTGLRFGVVDDDNWHELRRRGLDPALPWVVGQLSHPEVGAASVVAQVDRPATEVGWQWPLRVGVLSDERSAVLREEVERDASESGWLDPLVHIVDGTREACDLLLIPLDLRLALAAVASLPTPPRADVVIALGRTRGESAEWYSQVGALRATARTSGVVLAHVPLDQQPQWLASVVRSLSHAEPLDAALFSACREAERPAPFIAASARLLEYSRLTVQVERSSARLRRTAEQLKRGETGGELIDLSELTSTPKTLDLDGLVTYDDVAARMTELGGDAYGLESAMATTLSEIERINASVGAELTPPPEDEETRRYLQARVFDVTDPSEPDARRYAFRSGAVHEVVVRVGRPDDGWLAGPRDTPFPDERLPPDQDEHRLTVVFTVLAFDGERPEGAREPQVGHVVLPQDQNSSECRFTLFVPPGVAEVEARLAVLHQNRVLQTALVIGPASDGPDESVGSDEGRPGVLAVVPEVAVRASLDDLDFREPFDVSILANHTRTGLSGATVMNHDSARQVSIDGDMDRVLREIGERLTDIAYDLKGFGKGLTSDSTADLLRTLARLGAELYDYLVVDVLGEGAVARGERVQVVSARPEARLPIEVVYGRKAPSADALLCPDAEASLREGACQDDCPGRPDERGFVCPLAFWGLSRVIERHRHDPDLARKATDAEFALWAPEPTQYRRDLSVLTGGLVAGSQRVEETKPGGLQRLCDDIAGSPSTLVPVEDWTEWATQVATSSPPLLALLVHLQPTADSSILSEMEIGEAQWLPVDQLDESHVRASPSSTGPLVLLFGCKTGAPDVMALGFVSKMRRRGAAIVVAADATIHSVHAVPVARGLVAALQAATASEAPPTFGEVMRSARQTLLADGQPMVLALTAYGDADWRLVP